MGLENRVAQIPSEGAPLEVTVLDAPQPSAGEVLIRNHAVAVQPLDAKMLISGYRGATTLSSYPAVLGSGAAGVVEDVGSGVTDVKAGDRVVFDTRAYVDGEANRREGTWQQLVICNARSVAKIGNVAFEQAVLVDFPFQTAVAALHVFLGIGRPGSGSEEDKVLIWGAGGAVGGYAVQYAKSVGHSVVVTASPRDFERQKRLGAAEVVDYKDPNVVDKLRELGLYKYLFTASGDGVSQKALASLLDDGGRFASVLGGDVQLPSNVERVYLPFSQAAQHAEHFQWRDWYFKEYLPKVLQEDLLEAVKYTKREGGLAALQQASADVFEGKVRGKIVVDPTE